MPADPRAAADRHLWVWYSPFGHGGVETYLLNMVRESQAAGAEVWVAATRDADGPLRAAFTEAGAQLLDWTGFHAAFMGTQPPAAFQQRLVRDLAAVRPTLLALNDCNDFSVGSAPVLRRLRPCCTILDTLHIDSPAAGYLDYREHFLDAVDGIAATNRHVATRFAARFEGRSPPLQYIPNGVCVPPRSRAAATGPLRMLYVGRLAQDQKRVLELPALLAAFKASGADFTMTIVGDGPAREPLRAALAEHELLDRVSMTGWLAPHEVIERYFDHDILVNVSAFEGFSMSLIEALAAGCVPVCTQVASLDAALLVDGFNCRLCPTEDLSAMVATWRALNPATLAAMSAAAMATGQTLSARAMHAGYAAFIATLRERRPLLPWTDAAAANLQLRWDPTRHNPWLPRSAWRRLKNSIAGFAGGEP